MDEVGVTVAALPASQDLQGVSAAAKASLYLPPMGNGGEALNSAAAATNVAVAAASQPAPQPQRPPPPPVPSRPSQPMATEVQHNRLVLLWEPAPKTDVVDTYEVLAQTSGAGGFHSFLADTRSSHPIVRLDELSARTWYEFKIVAFNASGSSAASAASLPIQTGAAPVSPAKSAAATAAVTAEMHLRSPKRTDSENMLMEREEPELLSRYAEVSFGHTREGKHLGRHCNCHRPPTLPPNSLIPFELLPAPPRVVQCKRELVEWEANFERGCGRLPTEADKMADIHYQGLMSRCVIRIGRPASLAQPRQLASLLARALAPTRSRGCMCLAASQVQEAQARQEEADTHTRRSSRWRRSARDVRVA